MHFIRKYIVSGSQRVFLHRFLKYYNTADGGKRVVVNVANIVKVIPVGTADKTDPFHLMSDVYDNSEYMSADNSYTVANPYVVHII